MNAEGEMRSEHPTNALFDLPIRTTMCQRARIFFIEVLEYVDILFFLTVGASIVVDAVAICCARE